MKLLSRQDIIATGLFRQTTLRYFEVNRNLQNQGNDSNEMVQFKTIRDLILKEQTLFVSDVKFEASLYSLKRLDYYVQHQKEIRYLDSLLDFLVLNKEGMAEFGDKALATKLKPIVEEALKEPAYYEKLHELFLGSLYSMKATQFLLDCGFNPNYQNNLGLSPLMVATNTGSIKALLKAGADASLSLQKEPHLIAYFLGVSCVSDKYKALFGKNAYEIHSILDHASVIKVFDSQLTQAKILAYSEHFKVEYEKLKQNMSTEALIKAMKNENSFVLNQLNEFSSIFYDHPKKLNFVSSIIQLGKAHWLEKVIEHNDKETLLNALQWDEKNTYLENSLYQSQYKCAQILLKHGICDINQYNYDTIAFLIYDADLNQQFYELMPEKMKYHYALQACNIELIKKMMKKSTCDDETFNQFCEVLYDKMKKNDYFNHIHITNIKMNIVDCLATIVFLEKDEQVKQQRLDRLIKTATTVSFNYYDEDYEKVMKSKAQRILKYFPEKSSEIMANLSSKFPQLVASLEEKNLKKMIQTPKNKKMKQLVIEHEDSFNAVSHEHTQTHDTKPKRNKI